MYFLKYVTFIHNCNFKKECLNILQGEITWKSDSRQSPSSASAFPPSSDVSRMMYVWVSDYMFNTLGAVAQQHGVLQYSVTATDVSNV